MVKCQSLRNPAYERFPYNAVNSVATAIYPDIAVAVTSSACPLPTISTRIDTTRDASLSWPINEQDADGHRQESFRSSSHSSSSRVRRYG